MFAALVSWGQIFPAFGIYTPQCPIGMKLSRLYFQVASHLISATSIWRGALTLDHTVDDLVGVLVLN
jgi:hypothetical protein